MNINSTKNDEVLQYVKKTTTLLRLFSYMKPYKKKIILVLLLMFLSIAITLINPLILKRAIDVPIANGDYIELVYLGMFATIINTVLFFLIRYRIKIMAKVCNSILVTIRQELYIHIQSLDLNFFDSRPTGKILARIIGDVNSLKEVLSNSVTILIPDLLTIISIAIIMFMQNAKLAAASLVALPFMAIALWLIETISHKRWQLAKKTTSNVAAYIHEGLSGIHIVQSFCAEKETSQAFEVLVEKNRKTFISAIRINDLFFSVVELSWILGFVAMYYIGIAVLGMDQVSIGTFVAFATYISMFWNPISNLSDFYNQLITNISGAERIFEVLDMDAAIKNDKNCIILPDIKGTVEFKNVTFAYVANKNILTNVSFNIHAGETIALVGPTGAGKSTIVNLIARFYDISCGELLIDGTEIRKINLESLRSQLGIMTQDNFIFSGTIKDNLLYGNLNATVQEMERATKAVCAHEFIMKLKDGYNTKLQERGGGLSVGQKQLLAFARTMLMNPKILILDEATSSIDTKTELLVQHGIASLVNGRTSFIIAHRLSTIQNADRVFVIDQNKIIESGTPSELMNKKGLYYDLYMAQFKEII